MTFSHILRLYSPLAISWLFMSVEGPVCVSIISRLSDARVQTASYFVLQSLSLWIESPVIDLLTTSTTLAKNKQSYAQLSRFVWWVMLWVTLVHLILSATPVYGLLMRNVLGLPEEVVNATHTALIIMIPWSAFIGWRRYLQGIMIRFGQTRLIGFGTLVRVVSIVTIGFSLYRFSGLPGVQVAGTALVSAVGIEALFVHWASRKVVHDHLTSDTAIEQHIDVPPLKTKKLASFHLPLTATTMVMLLSSPLISAALARTPNPQMAVLALAAWQVATSLMFMFRTITFALPEVVITLYRDEATARILKSFCVAVGCLTSGLLLVMAILGLDKLFFFNLLHVTDPDTISTAHLAFFAGAALPMIGALQSYVRGMLTAHHLTSARLAAVVVSVTTLILTLTIGVLARWPSALIPPGAMTVALTCELGALVWAWKKRTVGSLAT